MPARGRLPLWQIVLVVLAVIAIIVSLTRILPWSSPTPGPATSPAGGPTPTRPAGPPTASPSGVPSPSVAPATWSPIELPPSIGAGWYLFDSGSDGLAVIFDNQTTDAGTFMGLDLVNLRTTWSQEGGAYVWPSAQGLVTGEWQDARNGVHLQVIDASTGVVTAAADLPAGVGVINVSAGLITTALGKDCSGSVLDMTLHSLWQGGIGLNSSLGPTGQLVTGFTDDSLISSTQGLRDWRTGAAAGFGADAFGDCARSANDPDYHYIYYTGPSPDRALRIEDGGAAWTVQQWNPATDTAMSPAFPGGSSTVDFSANSPVYIALNAGSFTGYSWATGRPVFTSADPKEDGQCRGDPFWHSGANCGALAGSGYWRTMRQGSDDDVSSGTTVAVNVADGQVVWRQDGWAVVGTTWDEGRTTVYVASQTNVIGFDADSLRPIVQGELPAGTTPKTIGNRLVAATQVTYPNRQVGGGVYVLNP